MRARLVLMADAIGLLFVAFMGAGCSAAILSHQYLVGVEPSESNLPPIGTSRRGVETNLGRPVTSRALPDGGRVDSYQYTIRDPDWLWGAAVFGILAPLTFGALEPAILPVALRDVSRNRRTATLTYGPNDQVLAHGPPPPYGPPDAALGSLSLNEISERCRSEVLGDPRDVPNSPTARLLRAPEYRYDECIVSRLAMWGIE